MPTSAARVVANRANARLSTGPKTDEGKDVACLNRFAHGLSGSNFHMVPWENRAEFRQLRAALHAEHQPATPTETLLVDRMAEHHWLRGRALVFQEISFQPDLPHCHDEKQLALFMRYEAMHERAFHRCLAELIKLKKIRLSSEIGFESQNTGPVPGAPPHAEPPPSPAVAQPAPPVESSTPAISAAQVLAEIPPTEGDNLMKAGQASRPSAGHPRPACQT